MPRHFSRKPHVRALVLLVGTLASTGWILEACGSSSSSGGSSAGTGGTSTTAAANGTTPSTNPTTTSVVIGTIAQPSPAGTLSTKPTVTVPSGQPPTQLESADLITGNGATVQAGATVTVQYVGVSWTTGKQFDASWDRGQPIQFPLTGVIPGWGAGLVGMKVGGRRELIIPPDLAYGANPPAGSGIPPNDTLIFIVDLISIP